jgi:hypothetical protein
MKNFVEVSVSCDSMPRGLVKGTNVSKANTVSIAYCPDTAEDAY